LAAIATAFRSSAVKRTGTILPFASPFGILGRPTLAFFCCANSRLLNDESSHSVFRWLDWMHVQDSDVAARIYRIIGVMRPSIDSMCRIMALQVKDLNNPFPHRLALKCFFNWHTLYVRSLATMQAPNYVS
jgi:hypothetical protein